MVRRSCCHCQNSFSFYVSEKTS